MVTNPPPPAPDTTTRPTAECPECRTQVPVDTSWRFTAHAPSHPTPTDTALCPGSGTKPIRPSMRAVPGAAIRSTPTTPPPADWLN